jgi:carbonic anhydrase
MVKHSLTSTTLLLTILMNCASARSWRDIELFYSIVQRDNLGPAYVEFIEQLLLNETWSGNTTGTSPIATATNHSDETFAPSPAPSDSPTNAPTFTPSDIPSPSPTNEPSDRPSEEPTASPTVNPYPRTTLPNEGEKGYFDYDLSTNSKYGPSKWGSVSLPPSFYWDEFGSHGYGPWNGTLQRVDFNKNECERGQKHQSPIDVFETVSGCNETHEIREQNGDFSLSDVAVDKRIDPNKLRIIFPRRPCADINKTQCQFPHPPWADFPNGFPGIADATHIDLKIPSEHWLRGEIFDGELQVYHIHAKNGRVVAWSTLVRAKEQGHNQHFQLALDAFQTQYDKNQAACNKNRSSGSNSTAPNMSNSTLDSFAVTNAKNTTIWHSLSKNVGSTSWNVQSKSKDNTGSWNKTHNRRDLHNIPGAWSPYHPDIMSTIYYYRYEGSITEPPCSEFVTWFVNDTPMNISLVQLEQWKMIQFTNIDPQTCTSTSVHFGQNLARPMKRPLPPDRVVSRCTMADFGPDPVHSTDY